MKRRNASESIASWLVSAGRSSEPGAPLNTPLVSASNFVLGGDRSYAREDGTPTWVALEEVVGGLEGGRAVAFSSGMAAIAAVFEQLPVGSALTLPEDCYQGVTGLAEAGREQGRWSVRRLPLENTAAWLGAAPSSDLIWLESPSNPLLIVADLEAICRAERKAGSILAVDNTFATPLNQRPLELGADLAIHSATKFIGGHSDLLAGVAVGRTEELAAKLVETRSLTGATPGALESFLAIRGARTLHLRLERSQRTAALLAQRLDDHAAIERVQFPGLTSHPTHAMAAKQLGGFGSVLSFELAGGAEAADALCRDVRLMRHATSLGGVETTLERRSAVHGQEHLPPGLIRLSVGIEDAEDLWRDLASALA